MPKAKKKKAGKKRVKKKAAKVRKPFKLAEFNLYALWRSIPVALREMDVSDQAKFGFDIEDKTFASLVSCVTKGQFSKKFRISVRQMLRWDGTEKLAEKIDAYNKGSHILRFKKDVDFNFTVKTMQEADPARMRLWYRIFLGIDYETNIKVKGEMAHKVSFADMVRRLAQEKESA